MAAVLTIESAKTVVYKYGCSEARYHNTGAMPFVFWDMIRDAKLRGFQDVDLGRTEVNNTGLATFKERWGATRELLVYARFPPRRFTVSRSEKRVIYLEKLALARCPDSVLAAAGRVLYPHVG